jgi:hypothetical protein
MVHVRVLLRLLALFAALVLLALAVVLYYVANPKLPRHAAAQQVHYLEQWNAEDRQRYYFTPQGTQVKGLHYDWFTALELPFSQQRFAAPDSLARFGFLIDPEQKPTPNNPGNLPVGFARHQNPGSADTFLDITCAACHTGELRLNGQAVRIDGGSAQHVLPSSVPTLQGGSFGQALVASLAFTYYNPWKFERFARNVLGPDYDTGHQALREAFKGSLDTFLKVAWNDTHRGLYPTEEGPGRTDAFGRIANASFGDAISPANYRVADAPVDYPQLWDMWTFDWVQWNGSAQQPMARNIGEALGVGATLSFFDAEGKPLMDDNRYPSSVRVRDLHLIEQTLQRLKPPAWPEEWLGAVDKPLAAKGRALFAENCAGCHVPRVSISEGRPVQQLKMLPVETIGTDPGAANNIANHRFDLTALQWDPAELARLDVQLHPAPHRTSGPEPVVGRQGAGVCHGIRRQPRLSRGRRHAGRARGHGWLRPADRRPGIARLQGPAPGGCMGNAAIPAQRFCAEHLSIAFAAGRTRHHLLQGHVRVRPEAFGLSHRSL